ncbi:site-specific integrase, partial [Vibrio anguillarum]|nr:site-specific integrase [Vibrio anguillarum]
WDYGAHTQLQSGLRVEEACTFPIASIEKPDPHTKRYEIEIGPSNGVHTKFNKTRKVEIPFSLMNRMYFYSVSERRFNRTKKADEEHACLLLNNRGLP